MPQPSYQKFVMYLEKIYLLKYAKVPKQRFTGRNWFRKGVVSLILFVIKRLKSHITNALRLRHQLTFDWMCNEI